MTKCDPVLVAALCQIIFAFTFILLVSLNEVVNIGLCCIFPLAASQAAARARNTAGQQSAAASSITGMTLQEAQQILNVSTLTPEEIQKVQTHSLISLVKLLPVKGFSQPKSNNYETLTPSSG